jgi:hypothetical protein
MRADASGSSGEPAFDCTRHRIPAMWSLIVLMARRAIGISEKRRRFIGVGRGMLCARDP